MNSPDPSWHQPPEDRPTNWPVLVAGGLLLAVLTALVVFFLVGGDDEATPATDDEVSLPTLAPSEGSAPTGDPSPAGSGNDLEEQTATGTTTDETTTVDPARLDELTFQRVAGVRVPVHPTAGPTVQADGLASGFERSPLGAIVAAFNISGRSAEDVGPAVFRPTLAEQHTGDPADLEAELARVERLYERKRLEQGVEYGQPLSDPLFQYLGWSLDFYDGDNAEVRLLARAPGGDGQVIEATIRTPLRWEDGDWRYVAPPDGDLNSWVVTTFEEERFTMLDEVG